MFHSRLFPFHAARASRTALVQLVDSERSERSTVAMATVRKHRARRLNPPTSVQCHFRIVFRVRRAPHPHAAPYAPLDSVYRTPFGRA